MRQRRTSNSFRIFLPVVVLLAVGSIAQAQTPLTFSKAFAPNTIGPGSASRLSFTITNISGTPADNVAFTDTLPAGVTIATPSGATTSCSSATLSAPDGGTTITLSGGKLGPGLTCTVDVYVTSSTPGTHMNVSGTLTSTLGIHGTASADLTVSQAYLGFTKSFSPSTTTVGKASTLTFTIANAGASLHTQPRFDDAFPLGMTVANPANATSTCSVAIWAPNPGATSISFTATNIAAASSCTVSVDVVATSAARFENRSAAISSFTNTGGIATAALDVNAEFLSKQFINDPVAPGGTTTLQFTITNNKRDPVTGVTFTDNLSAALAGLAASGPLPTTPCGAGSVLSGTTTLSLTGGNLAPGASCTFPVTLAVPGGAAERLYLNTTSTVSGTAAGNPFVEPASSDNLVVKAVPLLTKTFTNDPVVPGGTVNLEFTITNPSPTFAATAISFTDSIPSLVASNTSGFCGAGSVLAFGVDSFGANQISITGADLAANSSCTFVVPLTVPTNMQSGTFPNTTSSITATINTETRTGPPASDNLVVVSAPRLTKSFTDDPVAPGSTVTLEFTLTHSLSAAGDATNISFTDDLNAALAGLTVTGLLPATPCGSGSMITGTTNLSFTGGTLTPGSSCTFSVSLQTPALAAPNTYTNTTSGVTATVLGIPTTSTAASDDLTLASLTFTKQFIPSLAAPGNIVTLRYMIQNTSMTNDAAAITFTDDLAAVIPTMAAIGPLPVDPCGGGSVLFGTTSLTLSSGNILAGDPPCMFDVTMQIPGGATPGQYTSTTGPLSATIGGTLISNLTPASASLTVLPSISLTKSFTNDPVYVGTTATLEFTITNSDVAQAATLITFTDDLDAALSGLTAVGPLPTTPCGAGSTLSGTSVLTLTNGTLPAQGTCTFQVTVQLPYPIPNPTVVTNTTSTISADIGGTQIGPAATDQLILDFTPVADLTVTKTGPANVVPGQQAIYTITVTNNGPYDAMSVMLADAPPAGLTFVSNAGACTTAFPCNLGTMASGASLVVTSTFNIASNLVVPTITNTATVSSATLDHVPGNNSSALISTVSPQADLSVTKTGPASVTPGQQVVYTITVTNNGPSDATAVTLADTPGVGLTFVSNAGGCTTAFPCSLGTLPIGASSTVTSTFMVASSAVAPVDNTATASAATTDPVPANNTATVSAGTTLSSDLAVTKTGPTSIIPGQPVVYTITVTNNGPSDATLVSLTDTPAPELTFVSNAGDCVTAFPCSLGTIPAGMSRIVTSTFNAASTISVPTITNTAIVSSAATDPVPGNNSSGFVSTTAQTDLAIFKQGPASVEPGKQVTYTITVSNVGVLAADLVSVTDTPEPGLVFVSNAGDCTTPFPCALGTVPGGAVRVITSTFDIPANLAANPISNTASVSSSTVDSNPANNTSSWSSIQPGLSNLSLKVSGPELAGGEDFMFAISLSNSGPSAATGVLLEVSTSPGVTFVQDPAATECKTFPCFIPSVEVNETKNITAKFNLSGSTTSPMVTTISVASGSIDVDPSDNVVVISTDTCPSPTIDLKIADGAVAVPRTGSLTWDAVNADKYEVYLGPPGEGCMTKVGTTTSKSFAYSGLDWRSPYEWRVVATKEGCPTGSVSSPCHKFTSGPPCPTAPPTLEFPLAGALNIQSPIQFKWSKVPAATSYNVWASIDGTPAVVLGTTETNGFVYAVSPGTIEWWVEVFSDDCTPVVSPSQTFTSSGSCVTRATALVSPGNGVELPSPVTFDWEPVGGAKAYSVWVSVDGKFPVVVASTTIETEATVRVSSGDIRWYVESRFDRCPPAISEIRTISVPPGPGCDTHQSPQLIEPTSGQRVLSPVDFSWTAVDDAIGYTVWAAIDGDSPSIIATTDGETTASQDIRSGDVEWFVQAIFEQCPSTESGQSQFTVLEAGSCDRDAPVPTFPSAGSVVTEPIVRFEWVRSAGADEYRVWIKVDGGDPMLLTSTPATVNFVEERVPIGMIEWYAEALFPGCPSKVSNRVPFEVPPGTGCDAPAPLGLTPAAGTVIDAGTPVHFDWTNVPGAFNYRVWLTRQDGAPSILTDTGASFASTRVAPGIYTWYVEALLPGCPPLTSAPIEFEITTPADCENLKPILLSPADGAVDLTSPVTFVWTRVKGATGYELWLEVEGSQPYSIPAGPNVTDLIVPLPAGVITWFVEATVPHCNDTRSSTSQLRTVETGACGLPAAPAASVVGEVTTGETYQLLWNRVAGSTIYEVQQTTNFNNATGLPDYTGSTVIPTTNFLEFTAPALDTGQLSLKIYYRVRGIADCNQQRGSYGQSVAVVVTSGNQSSQIGATEPISRSISLCADDSGTVYECDSTQAKARHALADVDVELSTTEDWLTVTPTSGTIPMGGALTVQLTADPSQLPTGTSTAGLVVTTTSASKTTFGNGGSVPISVGLATPVSPTGSTEPPPYAKIIPAVIHGDSATGTWQSDIRILNNASKSRKYQLKFTRSNVDGTSAGKQAVVEIGPGKMLAFDDIVRGWYGAATSSLSGVLEIRPTTPPSSGSSGVDNSTIAASRTYNNTPFGSYGQFVPGVSFSDFIGSAGTGNNSLLLLQQLSQSSNFRTNVGLVEASGNPADALIRVFGTNGNQLGEMIVSMKPGEHKQLNALLAQMGITAEDARAEIRVASGGGRLAAYASVVDAQTLDPTFVPGTSLTASTDSRRVLPGVADLDTGQNRWRTDASIYNASEAAVEATLTFYPQGNPEQSVSKTITVAPNEIRVLDDLLRSEFGLVNVGGAMHITTDTAASIIASARTYDQRTDGTVGQFIPSLTAADAASMGGRILNLLQVEESDRLRTNLGLAELSGADAQVEITAVVPNALVATKTTISLRANEFVQIGSIFRTLGFDTVFNGRLYIRVVGGAGKVGAYASTIDNETGDPAYVPAQ